MLDIFNTKHICMTCTALDLQYKLQNKCESSISRPMAHVFFKEEDLLKPTKTIYRIVGEKNI